MNCNTACACTPRAINAFNLLSQSEIVSLKESFIATGEKLSYGIFHQMQKQIADHLELEPPVCYRAFEIDRYGIPVNNLDEVALSGKVVALHREPVGNGEWLEQHCGMRQSPTWLELAELSNSLYFFCDLGERNIFDGFEVLRTENDVTYVQLKFRRNQ